ncbi:MAG: hypothetical protein PHW84_02055 [Methanosarcina sp.]|nr:hypothetical protein [Methanosarcina sp.]
MTESDFVTQDQRMYDLEDIALLKRRVSELEDTVEQLKSILLSQRFKKESVNTFLGISYIENSEIDSNPLGR